MFDAVVEVDNLFKINVATGFQTFILFSKNNNYQIEDTVLLTIVRKQTISVKKT